MELTPFEKLAAHKEKMALHFASINALMDLIEREKECQAQIEYYKTLTGLDREEERAVTMEAIKDAKALNAAIDLICKNISLEA